MLAFLAGCTKHFVVTSTKNEHYSLKEIKSDSLTQLRIDPYKNKLDAEMSQTLAICDSILTKDGIESNLSNFVLSAIDNYVNTDQQNAIGTYVGIINRGGLRTGLPKGIIRVNNIFELMPFENEMILLKITGEKLKECIGSNCKNNKLFSSNLSYTIKNNAPENILVHGKPIDLNSNYIIITTDYLANGGDNCSFFQNPILSIKDGIKLRDVIINYCKVLDQNKKHIISYTDGRIKSSE